MKRLNNIFAERERALDRAGDFSRGSGSRLEGVARTDNGQTPRDADQ